MLGLPITSPSPVRAITAAVLMLLLSACSAPGPDEQEADLERARNAAAESTRVDPVQPPPPGTCDATQVQGLVGQRVDAAAAEQAREDADAGSLRMIGPDEEVDTAFDGARLSIETDAKGIVTGLRCG